MVKERHRIKVKRKALPVEFLASLVDIMLELFELAIIFNNPIVLLLMMMLLLLVMLRYGLLTLRVGGSCLNLSGLLSAIRKGLWRLLLFFDLKSYDEIPTSWAAIVVATSVKDP